MRETWPLLLCTLPLMWKVAVGEQAGKSSSEMARLVPSEMRWPQPAESEMEGKFAVERRPSSATMVALGRSVYWPCGRAKPMEAVLLRAARCLLAGWYRPIQG